MGRGVKLEAVFFVFFSAFFVEFDFFRGGKLKSDGNIGKDRFAVIAGLRKQERGVMLPDTP